MLRLTREAFERSRLFLLQRARPLERALYLYRFEGADVQDVLASLSGFQNPDGGFGRALEMDLRSPSSSALATAIGLHTLCELDRPADEPMVRRAVAYLLSTYKEDTGVWRVAPSDVNSYPHGPWWHDHEGSLERIFDDFRIIPRALVLAGLRHYASLVPADLLDRMTEETVGYIESVQELGTGGGSDLEYAMALAETRGLPGRWRHRLERRIREAIPIAVVRDPERWSNYCLAPLRIIDSPDTIGAELVEDAVQLHLDHQIEHQSEEGTWDPVWSWGGTYPDAWAQARMEWRGHLTLRTLMQLHAFDRIG